jgi:hypothetical protein
MGRIIARLIVPSLVAVLALPAAEPAPLMELTIGDGARMIQRWDASLYAKLWKERALEPLRTKIAEQLAGIEGPLGFTLIEALAAMKSGDVRITGFIPPAPAATGAAPQPKARMLGQFDLGAFAPRLMELLTAGNAGAEILTIPGADAAIRPVADGNPTIERMTFARFGDRLLVDANRDQPPAPYTVTPGKADLSLAIDYRALVTVMGEITDDPKARATFATMRSFEQYLEPLSWDMTLVAEGIHERVAQKITYPGVLPVDRSLFTHLPGNTLAALALGFDSKAAWKELEPMLLKLAADQGQPVTAAQVREQIDQGLAGAGLPLTAENVFNSLNGTVLIAVTPSAPFPAVTIALPRSQALDQLLRHALTTQLMIEVPADGTSAPLPVPNLPLPITLIADAKHWVLTSDQTLGSTWFTVSDNNWSTSTALKTAVAKATGDAFLIGASDTPAVLRVLGGFLPLMPIQDAKDKQTITVMLARASGVAATGYLLGQHRDGGWEVESRGLLGFGAIPFIAGATFATVAPKRGDAAEISVVSLLRSGVFPAQIQFQAGAYVDQNGDNIGEYGFLAEMAGGAITGQPDTLKLSLLPEVWNATRPAVHGYRFSCWLPDGKGGAIGANDGARAQNAAAAKAQSERFVVYAWSADGADKPVYALTQTGSIYSSTGVTIGANGPAWNALFAGGGWDTDPAWEPQRRR